MRWQRILFAIGFMWLGALSAPSWLMADIANRLCLSSSGGCVISDGTDICVDTDKNGSACDIDEPNLTINAPNSQGDSTHQGILTVAQRLIASDGVEGSLTRISWAGNNGTDIGTAGSVGQCLVPFSLTGLVTCPTSGGSGDIGMQTSWPADTTLRLFCVQVSGPMTNWESDDTYTFIVRSIAASPVTYATIVVGKVTGNAIGNNSAACVPFTVTSYTAGTPLVYELDVNSGSTTNETGDIAFFVFSIFADGMSF